MAWRQIKVDGDVYRWTVGVTRAPRITGELESIRLTVIARGVSVEKRVSATFHGWVVEDLWTGRQQALMVTPAIVADIIRRSAVLGPAIDHAEAIFPAAVGSADPRDVAL
ncbi:MAG TPA: hypothetical protein VK698_29925, partial [Kofleriaceae bacterium]|nr:hypothetical protein [Kofleriaceae bacterium]